ncbi:MAG: alpha/beta hydrolase [Lachnospiraceae bacterium]|nr:alpha/beta hydrolase [Lachnospiraceae bacterium]
MIHQEIPIFLKGSGPDAKLVVYIQNFETDMLVQERPLVLLCPGGGYNHLSVREAESEALQFLAMGYHAAVLKYSVSPAMFPTQLCELAWAVKFLRSKAGEWHIVSDKIIVQGSSAGGHVAASLGVFWNQDWLLETLKECGAGQATGNVGQVDGNADNATSHILDTTEFTSEDIKPNGMLLCYPVITSGEFAHKGSFEKLAGEDTKLWKMLSLEHQVTEDTPPAFLWHTFTDGSVPVENSLLFVSALRRVGVSTEFHMYPKGQHGLALGSKLTASADGKHMQKECESWIHLAATWLGQL